MCAAYHPDEVGESASVSSLVCLCVCYSVSFSVSLSLSLSLSLMCAVYHPDEVGDVSLLELVCLSVCVVLSLSFCLILSVSFFLSDSFCLFPSALFSASLSLLFTLSPSPCLSCALLFLYFSHSLPILSFSVLPSRRLQEWSTEGVRHRVNRNNHREEDSESCCHLHPLRTVRLVSHCKESEYDSLFCWRTQVQHVREM